MARPRIYKTEAVVLKQMPLGEADRILTLYTPDMGKVRAVAKGVRRTKSKIGGHLELLNRVEISLSQGRNLDVVNEAQLVQSFTGLRSNLQRLSRALYTAELVDAFSMEQSANHAVYRLLLDGLDWLERTDQPDLLVRYFETGLLEHSGYRPELYWCVECRARLEPGDHLFSCAKGGMLCPGCRVNSAEAMVLISVNAMKVLRFLQREKGFAGVAGLKVSPMLLGEIERVVRVYIRFLVERELKSAEFVTLVSSGHSTMR